MSVSLEDQLNPQYLAYLDLQKREKMLDNMFTQNMQPQQGATWGTALSNLISNYMIGKQRTGLDEKRTALMQSIKQSSQDKDDSFLRTMGLPVPDRGIDLNRYKVPGKESNPFSIAPQTNQTQSNPTLQSDVPIGPKLLPSMVQPPQTEQSLTPVTQDPLTARKAMIAKMYTSGDKTQKEMAQKLMLKMKEGTELTSSAGKIIQDMRILGINLDENQSRNYLTKALEQKGKASTNVDVKVNNTPKLGPGEILRYDMNKNPYIENVQGGAKVTPQQAALTQSTQEGIKTVNELINGGVVINPVTKKEEKIQGLYHPDGSVNRKMLGFMSYNVPYTQGQLHRGRVRGAISAKLRADTGAVAPLYEVDDLDKQLVPSFRDSDAEVSDKLRRLQAFQSGFLAKYDPDLYRRLRMEALEKTMSKDQAEARITQEIQRGGRTDTEISTNPTNMQQMNSKTKPSNKVDLIQVKDQRDATERAARGEIKVGDYFMMNGKRYRVTE